MSRFLPYLVAYSVAHDLDRRGYRPGVALRALVAIPAAVVLIGFGATLLAFVISFTAWKLGIG